VAHGDDGPGHAEGVDDVEDVAGVVEPVGCVLTLVSIFVYLLHVYCKVKDMRGGVG
jgi:hypothetical protein